MDEKLYIMLVADFVPKCCNSEKVILPDEWKVDFESVFLTEIDAGI
jgi:hypothetical protein